MNYIQKGVPAVNFYTSMKDVAGWLEIELRDYDWHISDIDGGWCGIVDPSWVLGEEFAAKIEEFDYQFVWAVISAFPHFRRERKPSHQACLTSRITLRFGKARPVPS
ncbi:hypothetical protein EUZ85_22720 [Hahella sp. KA22]|uniref:hypothetical protein n=1 Tax=Hahella sp. KA22 TaxID=1628392 RepID=UPI000FDD1873|nr:hypothetical protein [Hahella sp. KA22]AZZ93382.1 hypothetical protein ENC22_20140 [Hahella sp. KA22]QAY56757.1 hypothetical protein EUZ85_22720 [Hahella sp. KA22]